MDFETFLKDLCLSELSDLAYVDPDAEVPAEYPSAALRIKLLPTINAALRQIYINHQIIQKELVLRTSADVTRYYLRPENAVTNVAMAEKYIIDSPDNPYIGDLARVDEVLDQNGVRVFAHVDNPIGGLVRMPRWDCLTFSTPTDGAEYLIRFRATAPKMVESQIDSNVMLELPPGYVDLLRMRVAERVYGVQKTQESVAKAMHYKSEAAELEAALSGQDTSQGSGFNFDGRMQQKGFI